MNSLYRVAKTGRFGPLFLSSGEGPARWTTDPNNAFTTVDLRCAMERGLQVEKRMRHFVPVHICDQAQMPSVTVRHKND